jgi:transcriptional regulator with XRE-family HTH domain
MKQLAIKAELSMGFLSDLENDKCDTSIGSITRLSNALGVSVEWLVRGREVKPMKCPLCKGQGVI